MEKNAKEQGESPSGALESQQQPRADSMGDDGSFFFGR